MVKITGNVWDVGKNATRATEVRVHADMYRTDGDGLVTTETVKADVTRDGGVDLDVLPGMAVMHLVGARKNIVGEIPLLVPDRAATLAECILAARNVEGRAKDGLEEYVFAVRDALPQAQRAAEDAKSSADSAKRSADAAAASQEAAKINESASWSARNQSSTHASNAGRSAAEASADAGRAAESASDAADSAGVAKSEADRAATIAGSTRWVGTKLEVNGKLSPDLKGEKGDKGDTGARGAQGPRGPQGDLGPKGDKGDPGKDGTMRFEDLTAAQRESLRGKDGAPGTTSWSGLTGKPSAFPPEAHKHTVADITDLPTPSTRNDPQTLVARDHMGNLDVSDPYQNMHAVNKRYVDNATKWANITGKPTSFTPAAHSHTLEDVEGLLARFGGGNAPTAAGAQSVAVGSGASADGGWGTAVGSSASAAGYVSTALGQSATADGKWSTALGARATASGDYSQALTAYSKSTKNRHTVIGIDATDENIPTDVMGTVVIGKNGVPVYLAGVDVVTELNALKAQVEAQPKVQVVGSVPANPDPNTLYLIG